MASIVGASAPTLGLSDAHGNPPARSHSARALTVTDTAKLHYVSGGGSAILEIGHAAGTLPGTVKADLNVGATVIVKFTIDTQGGGSITGEGSGELKGRPAEPSFAGTMTVHGGSGRYAHAHGTGGFYGTLTRATDAVTVQTTGTLAY